MCDKEFKGTKFSSHNFPFSMLTRENPWKLHCLHLQTVSFSMLDKRGDPRRRNSLSPDRKCVCYFSFFSFHFIAAHNFQKNECSDGKIEFMLECKLCYKLNDDDEENHVTNKSHHRIVRAKELRESQWNWGNDFSQSALATQTQIVWRISTPSIVLRAKSQNDDTGTFQRAGIS